MGEEETGGKAKGNGLSGAAGDSSSGTSSTLNPQPSTLNPQHSSLIHLLIIGLTGPNAAGKGEAAEALKALGFVYHSLSDAVREEAVRRGRSTGRDDLILTGNELRREGGAGILAELAVPKLGSRDLVDSIRNPAEVDVLRGVAGFVLLGVTAPPPTRYERACQRQGRGDAIQDLDAFVAKEAEENTDDPAAQRLAATFALADKVIENDGSIEEMHRKVGAWVEELEGMR